MAPQSLAIRDASGSSSPNIGLIVGIVAGAVVTLAVLFAVAAALVPGSRVRRYFAAADASGYYASNYRYRRPVRNCLPPIAPRYMCLRSHTPIFGQAENREAARSGIRSTTIRGAANNDTILMRENNGVVMTLDNDTARVASMSPPDEASVPLVHAPTSPPGSPTSPSAGHPPSPTAVRFTPAHTPSLAVTTSAQDSDPPPPYTVISSL